MDRIYSAIERTYSKTKASIRSIRQPAKSKEVFPSFFKKKKKRKKITFVLWDNDPRSFIVLPKQIQKERKKNEKKEEQEQDKKKKSLPNDLRVPCIADGFQKACQNLCGQWFKVDNV